MIKTPTQSGKQTHPDTLHHDTLGLRASLLSKRTVIAIEGSDALGFANDLTTNDLARLQVMIPDDKSLNDGAAQATAFLTGQGTLQQFCLAVRTPQGLLLECDRARLPAFAETLWKARLARAVSFRWLKELQVVGLFPEDARTKSSGGENPKEVGQQEQRQKELRQKELRQAKPQAAQDEASDAQADDGMAGYFFPDPREPLAAMRLWHRHAEGFLAAAMSQNSEGCCWAEEAEYEAYRLSLGVVERAEEWEGEREQEGAAEEEGEGGGGGATVRTPRKHALPFAFGLDALGVMDWQKDCYVGQEIAARLKYRARAPKKHGLAVRMRGCERSVRAGDKVFVETKEGGEKLCGEVLYCVVAERQTILLVLFNLASLRLRRGDELVVVCASGERLRGELLLPRWLAGLWGASA